MLCLTKAGILRDAKPNKVFKHTSKPKPSEDTLVDDKETAIGREL